MYFTRQLLLLMVIHELLAPVHSINGVIWDKNTQDFVPIVSIPIFAALNQELLNRSLAEETHNFQGRIVRFAYFEIKNIVMSKNNGTSVTGVIGEIWNTLAELLNFTLQPQLSEENTVGFSLNNSFQFGLLGLISFNKTDVIPRVELSIEKLAAMQFTLPLIKSRYQYYIRPNPKHVEIWMLQLFSKKVWFAILGMYILFCLCSYLTQSVDLEVQKKPITSLYDNFFFNFGMMCSQNYYTSSMSESFRTVEYLISIFSLLINTAFNALVISYMTQTFTEPPFKNIDTLLETPYNIYTVNGSLIQLALESNFRPSFVKAQHMKRLHCSYSVKEMFEKLCTSEELITGILSDDIKQASGMYICRLNPVGNVLIEFFVASGVSRYFKHKRSIDVGLMKLHERGIAARLWYSWVKLHNEEEYSNTPQAIVLEQVHFILNIFCSGLLLSFILFILEHIIFYWKQ